MKNSLINEEVKAKLRSGEFALQSVLNMKSKVWENFDLVIETESEKKPGFVLCKKCHNPLTHLGHKKSGTSSMLRHKCSTSNLLQIKTIDSYEDSRKKQQMSMQIKCQTSPESSSQIQTFGNRHYINHENLKESFSDEACSNQDYVLGHSTNDEHAENRDQEFGSSVKVEDESIEFESYETDDSFNSEPNCKLEFKNEETNSSMNIISSSDVECRISTEQSASISTGVLHSSTEQSKFHEAPLSDSTSIFNNSDSDEETDSAFCSYILKEMRCVRNAYKKRMLKMKIISEILNAQQNSS